MKNKEESPLHKLVIKSSKKVEEIMYSILKDYIVLDEDNHEVILLETARSLNAERKILLLLLGYKAMEILGWIDDSSLTPREIAKRVGVNYNTVRSVLSRLHQKGMVSKIGRGMYKVELSRILEISSMFKREEEAHE